MVTPPNPPVSQARSQGRTRAPRRVPALDRGIAAAVTLATAPLSVLRAGAAYATTGRVFDDHPRLDADGAPFTIRSFAGDLPGRRLPFFLSVLDGRMALFGPHPVHPADEAGREARTRGVVPGLMSRTRLRARTGIDYDPDPVADDTTEAETPGAKAALLARYLVAEILQGGWRPRPGHLHVLGVEITNTTMADTLAWIARSVHTRPVSLLGFVNSDCLNLAVENEEYRSCLVRQERVVPDGIGVKLAARLQGYDLAENVNGTDLLPRLCAQAAELGHSIYFLGARPGVAQAAADAMVEANPGLRVAGVRHGYFDAAEEPAVLAEIGTSGADILLVAFGAPRQEIWLDRHRDDLDVGVAMGVGGLFDFYSGRIPRAPVWVREVGAEWVWRLAQEPGRLWRRYVVGNPKFVARAAAESRRMRHTHPAPRTKSLILAYGLPWEMLPPEQRRSA